MLQDTNTLVFNITTYFMLLRVVYGIISTYTAWLAVKRDKANTPLYNYRQLSTLVCIVLCSYLYSIQTIPTDTLDIIVSVVGISAALFMLLIIDVDKEFGDQRLALVTFVIMSAMLGAIIM